MTTARAGDIATTAGELHHLLQGASTIWSRHLLGKLNPNVPYVCRALAAGLRAFVAGSVTAEQYIQFTARLLDCDYKDGKNSYRTQKELGELLGRSEITVRRGDAAIRLAGLVTKKQSRRGPAVLTMISSEQLDQMFTDLGGQIQKAGQDRSSAVIGQDNSRPVTEDDGSKFKTGQNKHVRPVTLYDRLPYADLKKKGAQAHARGSDDAPLTIAGAFRRWVLSFDAGWTKDCQREFGNAPDNYECLAYRRPKEELEQALNLTESYIKRIGKDADRAIDTRLQTIRRRIKETAECRLSGATVCLR